MDILIIILFLIALIKESLDNAGKNKQHQPPFRRPESSDHASMDALFVLMAAEDGVFVPGSERVFDRIDGSEHNSYSYSEVSDDNCDEEYEEDRPDYYDDEYQDHWGPI